MSDLPKLGKALATDIGHGVTIERRYVDGKLHGIACWHTCVAGGIREAFIPLRPRFANGWDVVSVDPLTLTPSIPCRACGRIGWLTEGKWVPE